MPNWISDPSPSFTFVLMLAAAISVGIWYRYRDKSSLRRMIGVLAVVLTLLVISQMVDSPREEANARVKAMVNAANARDPKAFVDNLSDQFQSQGMSKEAVKNSGIWGLIKTYDVRIAAWDFSHSDCTYPDGKSVEIGFMAKGESGKLPTMRYVKAMFVKDSDGKYRLSTFKFYDAAKRNSGPEEPIAQFR